jgi:lipopolysaccharide heptosyltransferase I
MRNKLNVGCRTNQAIVQSAACSPQLKSVLIVKLGSLGDVVHALPLVNALRDDLPHVRVDWVVERKFSSLLDGHPAVDEVIVFDRVKSAVCTFRSFVKVIRKLRSRHYDVLIDLQGNLKGSAIVFLSGCSCRMGFRRGSSRIETASTFFTNRKIVEDGAHIIERNLSFAEALGVGWENVSFRIPVSVSAREQVESFLRSENVHEKRLAILHPGVSWVSKKWPLRRYTSLVEAITERFPDAAVVVTTGPGEEALGAELKRTCRAEIVLAGNMSLPKLTALLDRCEVFISSDTGPLHLAAALGKRVIGLYGPTDPVRNGPYGEGNFAVSAGKACSGCWRRSCRDLSCMNDIDVPEVMEKVSACLA